MQRQIEKDTMDDYEPVEQYDDDEYYEQYEIKNERSNSEKKNPGPPGKIRSSAVTFFVSDVLFILLVMLQYVPVRSLKY